MSYMTICVMILVFSFIMTGVMGLCLWAAWSNLLASREYHRAVVFDIQGRFNKEELARGRVIRLLGTVHNARHPDWIIPGAYGTQVWQGLADGLLDMMPKDADMLAILDAAFSHEEKVQLTPEESKGE